MENMKKCLIACAFLMKMDDNSALTVDNCLQQKASTLKQYLSRVMNVGTLVDSLFLWASSRAYGKHINLVDGNGVWTTRHTAIPDLLDAAIVFMLTGYLFSPSVGAATKSQQAHVAWPSPADFLVLSLMVPYLCVFNDPVRDMMDWCSDMDLQLCTELTPIHMLLQEVIGEQYHTDLAAWLIEYKHLFRSASKWLTAQGLDFYDYTSILAQDGMCNGLELWLVSMLGQQPINMV